jgi:hypothetical protein
MTARRARRHRLAVVIGGNSTGPAPVRHWLLVQLTLAVTGWAVIVLGISCFV